MNAISSGENSVIGCFVRVLVSCKQAVAMDDTCRDCCQGLAFEQLDDHIVGLFYIFIHNFCQLYFTYAGNFAVEIIASRRAEQCNTNARLREAHRTARMRAGNATAESGSWASHCDAHEPCHTARGLSFQLKKLPKIDWIRFMRKRQCQIVIYRVGMPSFRAAI